MIEREEENNEEEAELKVTDKRKFHVDGSLRDGVTIEKEEPKEAKPIEKTESEVVNAAEDRTVQDIPAAQPPPEAVEENSIDKDEPTEEEVMNDQNPASFINFLSTLVTNAAASLGAMPHPATGQKSVDLETGKYWIDVLVMLRAKTEGNLHAPEKKLMDSILSDLQMQYLAISRASEEKLKAKAAEKFSSKDILGG